MKLVSFHIDHYLMLRDLSMRFDRPGRLRMGAYALDFLVGLNGSGKSTLLRALAQTVTDLYTKRPTPFGYRLEYELQREDQRLHVQVTRHQPNPPTMTVFQGDVVLVSEGPVDEDFLPEKIVVYTTGNLASWEALVQQMASPVTAKGVTQETLDDAIKRSIIELPGRLSNPKSANQESDAVQSPLMLLRESRTPIITLIGLLASITTATQPLNEVLGSLNLVGLHGFSLRLRLHSALSDYDVFEKIRPHATRHIQQGSDHLLVFELPDNLEGQQEFVNALWSDYATPLAFYDALDRLCEPLATGEPTLQEVNIFLERHLTTSEDDEATRLLLFEWLSDGERSFLGRMCMLAMLQTENTLILLDEPEVHFNDYWKREIVKLIDVVMSQHANHLLIVSHSSIALSDVTSAQVTVMRRGEDGFSLTYSPTIKTLGTEPSEIMVVVFRTGLSTGAFATQLLESVVKSNERLQVENFLALVGPGMWFFQLHRRLEDLNASST